jgi:hypothetical protein
METVDLGILPVQFQQLVGLAAPEFQGVTGVENVLGGFMFKVHYGDGTVLDYSAYSGDPVVIEAAGWCLASSPVIRQPEQPLF